MKNRFFFCLLLLCIILFSCSQDEKTVVVEIEKPKINHIGDFETGTIGRGIDQLCWVLNTYIGTDDEALGLYNRTFTATVDGEDVGVVSQLEDKDNGVWLQKITTKCSVDLLWNDTTDVEPDHFHRTYVRRLRFNTAADEVATMERRYDGTNWEQWRFVDNPYYGTLNYGKSYAICGGSFAYNTRGYGEFNMPYDDGRYGLADFIALWYESQRVDNYAQPGNGWYLGHIHDGSNREAFKYPTLKQLEDARKHCDIKGITYDVFILFGGVNDYLAHVPLGKYTDDETADTYCGSIKKSIKYIKTNFPNARIYMATAFKAFTVNQHGDALYNINTKRVNNDGHRFYEYVTEFKNVASEQGVPLLDIFSLQNIGVDNFAPYYLSDCLHPNGNGYYSIAWAMLNLLMCK